MKQNHDKISKEDRLEEGAAYEVRLGGKPLFEAEVTKYSGGCWAFMKVNKAVDAEYSGIYNPGDEFQLRLATYEFYPIGNDK